VLRGPAGILVFAAYWRNLFFQGLPRPRGTWYDIDSHLWRELPWALDFFFTLAALFLKAL